MIKYLTTREEDRLLKAVNGVNAKRNKAIISLALNTGLRVSELTSLLVGDVKVGRRIKDSLLVRRETSKGHKERMIPLNTKAKKSIRQLISWNKRGGFTQEGEDPLLISQKSYQLGRQQLFRILKGAGQKAGLDISISPHTLRHTFATRVLGKTNNLRVVQKLLGHSSVATTQVYADVTRDQLRDAVDLL